MRIPNWTRREEEILALMRSGTCCKQMARVLGNSEATVRKQRSAMMHKAGVQNAIQLLWRLYGVPDEALLKKTQ
ncbi:MAG: LuxR C-terminal-related transcriptional regulator [Burkholderiaceae bacterium]|jgi:DNA-binding NarL/FixJ family response regulator|nr:LuxR C-terminal-related transcriptional regulator [Burkholderiaceae bacterium]